MKDYHIEDFVNRFMTLMELSQPKISTIIHLDYTAFPTAKQIWLQNIHDRGQESIELRNKAQQLMRVLQEDQHQHAGSKYMHWQTVKDRNQQNQSKEQEIMKRQQRASKLRECKQPGLEIKIEKQHREVKKGKKSEKLIFRDENIDSSNMSQSSQLLSKHDTTLKPGLTWAQEQKEKTKIIELQKKQYLKQVPKHDSIKKEHTNKEKYGCCHQEQMQLSSKKEHYEANCLHIKYECCCKNRNSQSFHDANRKVKIGQFLLQEVEDAESNEAKIGMLKKLTRQNQVIRCTRQKQGNQKKVLIQQAEQEHNLFDQNNSQSYKGISNSSNPQAGVLRQFHYDKRTVQPRKQQMEERNKSDLQNARKRERSKQVLDYQKYSKLRFEEKMRNMQIQRQLEMKKQMEVEKRQNEQLQQKRRMVERRQQQKRRENSLLNRLKEEFSEICNKEPASEEKRISEQIQQLEMKLNQIIAHDKSSKNHVQSHSINAKVVRLNLTPSRNNLHKNTGIPRSPSNRSPVVQKTQRLLSKRIENAVKN